MKRAINENIHELRLMNNMTLEELAKAIGTSRQTIQRYETGEISTIPYEKITRLAKALHTTPPKLMGWDGEQTLTDSEGSIIMDIYTSLPPDSKQRLFTYAKKLKELSEMEE